MAEALIEDKFRSGIEYLKKKIWITKEGETIYIENIKDKHLINIINMLNRQEKHIKSWLKILRK